MHCKLLLATAEDQAECCVWEITYDKDRRAQSIAWQRWDWRDVGCCQVLVIVLPISVVLGAQRGLCVSAGSFCRFLREAGSAEALNQCGVSVVQHSCSVVMWWWG